MIQKKEREGENDIIIILKINDLERFFYLKKIKAKTKNNITNDVCGLEPVCDIKLNLKKML